MASRIWRLGGIFLVFALAAEPCSIATIRKLWGKKPGTESKLFAFERRGRVGFIDSTGKVIIQPYDCRLDLAAFEAEPKPSVRKFEPRNFFDRDYPGPKGFIDRTGKVVIKTDIR